MSCSFQTLPGMRIATVHLGHRKLLPDDRARKEIVAARALAQLVDVDTSGGIAGKAGAASRVEQGAKAQFVGLLPRVMGRVSGLEGHEVTFRRDGFIDGT